MLALEFHCHTSHSPDSLVSPAALVETCRQRGIDRVVITDHNRISGALEAQQLAPELVIVGEEILTTRGELLCAFVKEEIPSGLPPREAIDRLRTQGAFISVSHPFDRLRKGAWELPDLLEIAPLVDAIETFNARCLLPAFNRRAADFARQHSLAGTSGSDAHTLVELGRALMRLPDFHDADSLRRAISEAEHLRSSSGLLARLGSRYAALRHKLSR